MGAPGDIHYARTSDGIDIAYTVFGEGPDLLVSPGFVTHMDLMWDLPPFEVIRSLGRHFRVIVLDKRGTGLSDRSLGFGSLENRAEDIHAVLDAVDSKEAVIYAISESGPLAVYFTAAHPQRVRALVLYATFARLDVTKGARFATNDGDGQEFADPHKIAAAMERDWGKGLVYQNFLSHPPDPIAAQRVLARYERNACTPQMCREIMERNFEMDVTPMLPMISVPSLILHCNRDPAISVEYGRDLADRIPGAKYVEIDGDFHGSWRREDNQKLGVPLTEFLTEVLGEGAATSPSIADRELATVLFTDIVSSTERAVEVGDSAWKAMLDQYERSATEIVAAAGGRLVKMTGDGLLATFTGPSHGVAAARALQDAALSLGVGVRAGLHTGEIERRGEDIGGIGVHIAARAAAMAASSEILVTRTVRDLTAGSTLEFEDRGSHMLKGVPEPWHLFAVR